MEVRRRHALLCSARTVSLIGVAIYMVMLVERVATMSVWPDENTVAVSVTVDVDAEAGVLGMGREYSRRLTSISEGRYGVTRGMPRILAMLERLGISATFFVPGRTAELHPRLVESLLKAGHEVGHHGYMHLRSDKVSADIQAEEIDRGLDALSRAGAHSVVGYRSPAWELTPETFSLLVDRGFQYDSSCMGDDRPYIEQCGGRQLTELPVHWSLDDYPYYGWSIDSRGSVGDPDLVYRNWVAAFDCARAEGRTIVYTIHPEFSGRAMRMATLEAILTHIASVGHVWFARLDRIAEALRAGQLA